MTSNRTESEPFPREGRLAAIDYGTVRIGIAVCDPDRRLASPHDVRDASNWHDDEDFYRDLVREERLVGFVVGLPIHCDGGESQKSKECRMFARWLAEATKIPVRLFDERFTTADANRRIAGAGLTRQGKKKRLDAVAALVLLESFMEACHYRDEIVGQAIDEESRGDDSLDDNRP